MKRIVFTYFLPFIGALIAATLCYSALLHSDFVNKKAKFEVLFDAEQGSEMQLFQEDDQQFKAGNMRSATVGDAVKNGSIGFEFPFVYKPGRLRLDPGFTRGKWLIRKITLKGLSNSVTFGPREIFEKFKAANDIKDYHLENEGVYIESGGPDPNLVSVFSMKDYIGVLTATPPVQRFPLILSICIGIFVCYALNKKLKHFAAMPVTAGHVLILLFMIILVLPFTWMNLFPAVQNEGSGENRELAQDPTFNVNNMLAYPAEYNRYFDDNFGFRKSLSTLNSYYKLKFFGSSSKPDMVAIGRKSWLFSTDPSLAGDYQNQRLFTISELQIIQHNLEEAYDWHEAHGIHFFVMLLPVKSNIYPEYLPDFIRRKNQYTRLMQVRDYLKGANSRVQILDVTNELLASKSGGELYYQHDFHMNFEGGFIAYTKLLNAMHQYDATLVPMPITSFRKTFKHLHNADLSRQLSLEDVLLNDEWLLKRPGKPGYRKADPPVYASVQPIQPTAHTQVANAKLPKVIVYRDSYFNLLSPFFSEHFSDCIYLWTNELSPEAAEKEHPKFVVYEMLESSLNKLLEDNPTGIKKQKQ